jgi:hypothetical protein
MVNTTEGTLTHFVTATQATMTSSLSEFSAKKEKEKREK